MVKKLRCTAAFLTIFSLVPAFLHAWNIPTHMITGAMAHRLLQSQNPQAAVSVQALLEKHPWYADRWRHNLESPPDSQRDEMLFMLAARWADDIRTKDKAQNHGQWHYINWPFRLNGEIVTTKPPEDVNILTALAAHRAGSQRSRQARHCSFLAVSPRRRHAPTAAYRPAVYPDIRTATAAETKFACVLLPIARRSIFTGFGMG